MTKRFRITTPEQLLELDGFCKTGSTKPTARVWRAEQRRGRNVPWLFEVTFSAVRGERHAVVNRMVNGMRKPTAWLNYAPALAWCEQKLVRMDTGT